MKLVLLFERRHVYSYDYEMWGIKYFENNFSEVELWSCVDWTFDNTPFPLNGIRGKNIFYISSKSDLLENLNRIKSDNAYFLLYPYHAYSYKSYLIRKSIKNYGFHFSNLTESPTIDNIFEKRSIVLICSRIIYSLFKSFFLFFIGCLSRSPSLIEKACNHFFCKFGFILAKSDFNFVTTSVLFFSFPNYFEKYLNKNVLLHSESYEEYMSLQNDFKEIPKQKYAVFIDQFSAGHSDFIKMNMKPEITDPQSYYKNLCYLFNKIEDILSYKVIIAAHPKAEYKGNEFGNREIVYFKTPQLIKNASLVINQNSTAFGLACLYKKDFLHIFSKEMFDNIPYNKKVYKEFDKLFKSRLLDISNHCEVNNLSSYLCNYSEDLYKKYIDLLIISSKSKSNNKFRFEIVSEYIFNKVTQLYGKK